MKLQIRRGVFESNSSSTHSLTLCSGEEFDKWARGLSFYDDNYDSEETFIDAEKVYEKFKDETDIDDVEEYLANDEFGDNRERFDEWCATNNYLAIDNYEGDYEWFQAEKTINGERAVAFGYFG